MPTPLSYIVTRTRQHLIEPTPNFWSNDELAQLSIAGIKDLWRDIVDLKQEHFLKKDTENVTFPANATQLAGVPLDVHKIYMIEPRDLTVNGSSHGLFFKPLPYNDNLFQLARSQQAIDPQSDTIFYALSGQGSPVNAPIVDCAPKVSATVRLNFVYCPTLPTMTIDSFVPIPGEADNALVAWTVAYARAKEREDRSPDPMWLGVYATEKAHVLQALGLRQYQEPSYAKAMFEEYWG